MWAIVQPPLMEKERFSQAASASATVQTVGCDNVGR